MSVADWPRPGGGTSIGEIEVIGHSLHQVRDVGIELSSELTEPEVVAGRTAGPVSAKVRLISPAQLAGAGRPHAPGHGLAVAASQARSPRPAHRRGKGVRGSEMPKGGHLVSLISWGDGAVHSTCTRPQVVGRC